MPRKRESAEKQVLSIEHAYCNAVNGMSFVFPHLRSNVVVLHFILEFTVIEQNPLVMCRSICVAYCIEMNGVEYVHGFLPL